jgi:uncharacterized protein YaiE (UPF0345 family)
MYDVSTTAASNYPAGSDTPSALDDSVRALGAVCKSNVSKGVDIASAATITIPALGGYFVVTGVATITTIADTNAWTGRLVTLKFSGALTLTHSAGLILQEGASHTTAAGDTCDVVFESTGVWRVTSCSWYAGTAGSVTNITGTSQSAAITWSGKQTFSNTVKLDEVLERITITASAPVTDIDCLVQGIQYFTSNATANWTQNFRGDGSNSLNSQMAVGESLTITVLATQSSTGYLPTTIQVDGTTSGVTTKYLGGSSWTADASCINAFTFTIIKTASATFTVLASKSKYA